MRKTNREFFRNKEEAFLKKLKFRRESKWAKVRRLLLQNLKIRRKMQIGLKANGEDYLYFPNKSYFLKGSKRLFSFVKVGDEYKVR